MSKSRKMSKRFRHMSKIKESKKNKRYGIYKTKTKCTFLFDFKLYQKLKNKVIETNCNVRKEENNI